MLRIVILIAVFPLCATQDLLAQGKSAPPKSLPFGTALESELGGDPTTRIAFYKEGTGENRFDPYVASIPITLKAGQDATFTATVTGKDRLVGIMVLDPTQKRIGTKINQTSIVYGSKKTITFTLDEVSAKGQYTIIVASDQIGPFTLRATSSTEE